MYYWSPPGFSEEKYQRTNWWDGSVIITELKSPFADPFQSAKAGRELVDLPCTPKLTFQGASRAHNYGNMIAEYCPKFPSMWDAVVGRTLSDLSDQNKFSRIQQYLDGLDSITVKHLLASTICGAWYAPNTVAVQPHYAEQMFGHIGNPAALVPIEHLSTHLGNARGRPCTSVPNAIPAQTWFIKPSHPHIGSAADIKCITSHFLPSAPALMPSDASGVGWVYQAAVTPALSQGRKWDCRHYAVVLYDRDTIAVFAHARSFARICVSPYAAGSNDLKNQVTNISLQEELPGYSFNVHEVELARDAVTGPLAAMVTDVAQRATSSFNQRGGVGFVILGFDTIFTPITGGPEWHPDQVGRCASFAPILIEVNEQPCMNANETVEGRICDQMWGELMQDLLPLLAKPAEDPYGQLEGVAPRLRKLVGGGPGPKFGDFKLVHTYYNSSRPMTSQEITISKAAEHLMRENEPEFVKAYRRTRVEAFDVTTTHNPKPDIVREQARAISSYS